MSNPNQIEIAVKDRDGSTATIIVRIEIAADRRTPLLDHQAAYLSGRIHGAVHQAISDLSLMPLHTRIFGCDALRRSQEPSKN